MRDLGDQGFTRPYYTSYHGNSHVPATLHTSPGHEFVTPDPQKTRDGNLHVYNFKIPQRETANGRSNKCEYPNFSDGSWTDAETRALMEGVYQHGTSFHVIKCDPLLKETLQNKTREQLQQKWREINYHSPAGSIPVHIRLDAFLGLRRPY